jgi:hypothetical protein
MVSGRVEVGVGSSYDIALAESFFQGFKRE